MSEGDDLRDKNKNKNRGFPYKVHLCLRDDPGSFIRVFAALRGDKNLLEWLSDISTNSLDIIDFHSFSVAPCTRFSKLPRLIASVMTEIGMGKLSIIRKYKLHSLVFIYSDRDLSPSNTVKRGRREVESVIEMHACFRDRGFEEGEGIEKEPNVIDKIIGLMLFLYKVLGTGDNESGSGSQSEAKSSELWDKDFRALIVGSPREKHIAKSLGNREVLKAKLIVGYACTGNGLSHNEGQRAEEDDDIDKNCPARGTCPIAHACSGIMDNSGDHRFESDFLERLMKSSTICGVGEATQYCRKEHNGKSDRSDRDDKLASYLCDAYFIRDHEDYTPDRSYMEIYGECRDVGDKRGGDSEGKQSNPNRNKGSDVDDYYVVRFLNALNIITLSILTHNESGTSSKKQNNGEGVANQLSKKIKNVLEKYAAHLAVADQIYVRPVGDRRVIVLNRFFSCDDIRCDINRIIRYVPNIGGGDEPQ